MALDAGTHPKRYLEVDLLRSIAVLTVVLHHNVHLFQCRDFIPCFADRGWQGVELFFIISGFVISHVLAPRIDAAVELFGKSKTKEGLYNVLKIFYVRRCFRLLPVCWALMFGFLVLSYFYNRLGLFSTPIENLKAMFWVAIYAMNIAVTHKSIYIETMQWHWSLSIEEQFYFIYPFFLWFVTSQKRRIQVLLGYILAITFVVRPFLFDQDAENLLRHTSYLKFDSIATGCLVYFVSKEEWAKKLLPKFLTFGAAGIVATAGAVWLFMNLPRMFSPFVIYPMVNLIGGLMVFYASFDKGAFLPIGQYRTIFNWIAKRSYIIYLINHPVIYLTQEFWVRMSSAYKFPIDETMGTVFLVTCYAVMAVLAEVVHRLIEKPMLERGERVTKAMQQNVAVSVEPNSTTKSFGAA